MTDLKNMSEDIKYIHRFIKCSPFAADAPPEDIARAHAIVDELARRLEEAGKDAGRMSFCQELREGLRVRSLWAPKGDSDLLTAVFQALDAMKEDKDE